MCTEGVIGLLFDVKGEIVGEEKKPVRLIHFRDLWVFEHSSCDQIWLHLQPISHYADASKHAKFIYLTNEASS